MSSRLETVCGGGLALTLCWRDGFLTATRLDWAKDRPGDPEASAQAREARAGLSRLARGERPHWPPFVLDLSVLSPFGLLVTRVLLETAGFGRTVTYGELAARCARPGAARAVGRVMARNPWPLIVPCHRVLGAGGRLGGYSAPAGPGLKKHLLGLEGALPDQSWHAS
ncbi:MAG: MGMT family protein [Desulfovibrionaceae bacterium]|nr:MGMT family protein [Desulfovibrionaceae bacterium]MDD4951752.1 MGMT family protein [Desulfovibrionaceae bacterium]